MNIYTTSYTEHVDKQRAALRWCGWRHPRRFRLQLKASPAAGRRHLVWPLLLLQQLLLRLQ